METVTTQQDNFACPQGRTRNQCPAWRVILTFTPTEIDALVQALRESGTELVHAPALAQRLLRERRAPWAVVSLDDQELKTIEGASLAAWVAGRRSLPRALERRLEKTACLTVTPCAQQSDTDVARLREHECVHPRARQARAIAPVDTAVALHELEVLVDTDLTAEQIADIVRHFLNKGREDCK